MRYYWTDERYQITYSNVILMLWKCWIVVREKMKFCAHDHGYCSFTTRVSGKNLNQTLLEVLTNCTKHFDLSSSLMVSCVARFMICWVCRLYFSGLVCSLMNVWLKLTMDDFVYVFDAWRKWSCGVVCVWPRTNSDTIISMFIWFCYLEWRICGGKLIWCDLLTSKIYQVEGTVLVSVCSFVNKINTYRLKRW